MVAVFTVLLVGGCSSKVNQVNQSSTQGALEEDHFGAVNSNKIGDSVASGTLNIVASKSQATYSLNEVLVGVPTHVVGTSNQISGQIIFDSTTKPASVTIGDILIDATSFKTDKDRRDEHVIKSIFKSDQIENKFIIFHTTSIVGIPETLTAGQNFPVEIIGDLTISGVTKPATFTGAVTWENDGSVTGSASTSLAYANFGLEVPNLSFLANVDKIVELNISFIAN